MSEELYIVVNIGCIECGVSSNIVGVYTTEAVADAIAAKLQDSKFSWREGGQNNYEVFRVPAIGVTNPEYIE